MSCNRRRGINKHILDCILVGAISALTTILATSEINIRIVFSALAGGLLAALIKIREHNAASRKGISYFVLS